MASINTRAFTHRFRDPYLRYQVKHQMATRSGGPLWTVRRWCIYSHLCSSPLPEHGVGIFQNNDFSRIFCINKHATSFQSVPRPRNFLLRNFVLFQLSFTNLGFWTFFYIQGQLSFCRLSVPLANAFFLLCEVSFILSMSFILWEFGLQQASENTHNNTYSSFHIRSHPVTLFPVFRFPSAGNTAMPIYQAGDLSEKSCYFSACKLYITSVSWLLLLMWAHTSWHYQHILNFPGLYHPAVALFPVFRDISFRVWLLSCMHPRCHQILRVYSPVLIPALLATPIAFPGCVWMHFSLWVSAFVHHVLFDASFLTYTIYNPVYLYL